MAITARNFLIILSKNSSKRVIQKTAETSGDLIGNKTADKISKILLHNNTEKITNESNKEMPKERYVSPKESQEIIVNLRLIL